MSEIRPFNMIENYIYLYHIKEFVVLPTFPDSLSDSMSANFSQTFPLARSAPIFSYSNSGPRTISVRLNLHRDMMRNINYQVSNLTVPINDDYVDTLINHLQAIALPSYSASDKLVDPPLVAIRFGEDIFCKGVISGAVSVDYQLPILRNGKYAQVTIAFNIQEVDPYDATSVAQAGSFRGLDTSLERKIYTAANR